MLRAQVTQRLTAAAEEILGLFERSLAEYEQEVLLLTHHSSSQQQGLETSPDLPILSVRQDSDLNNEKLEEQLQEPVFAPVCVKTEHNEDLISLLDPIPTEESRAESNGSDFEEAAPLSSPDSDSEEDSDSDGDSDSSETDDSEDYFQEQVPAKRSNSMIPLDSDQTPSGSLEHIPFSCLECGKSIKKKKNIERHMKTHIGEHTYGCVICSVRFSSISALTRHKRKTHNVCEYCPKRFETQQQLKSHLIVHTSERLYLKKKNSFCCLECGKKFTNKKTLRNHLKNHPDFFKCSVCTETFPTKKQHSNHEKTHKKSLCEGRPFPCPVCGTGFVEQVDLTHHLKVIHHICPVCTKGFKDNVKLMSHLSEHSESQIQKALMPFSCSVCQKRFSRDKSLQKHLVLHSQEKTFKCTVCDKSFRTESSLTKHTVTHRLECHMCDVKLEKDAAIEIHLCRIHQICPVCKEHFSDRDVLRDHLKSHSGVCPECGMNLKRTSLPLHLSRAHRICPVCEQYFTDQDSLREHLKVHIKDGTLDQSSAQIFTCEECGEVFFHKCKLWAHMRATGHE